MPPFETIFPTLLQKCAELHEMLRTVAFMLFIVGTMLLVLHRLTEKALILHLLRLVVLVSLLVMVPRWGNAIQTLLQNSILSGLGVDPADIHTQFNRLLKVKHDAATDHSWWEILADVNGFTVELLVSGVLWLLGQFASLLLFWAYIFQKVILYLGYALSPLLIGFMAIPALRSLGNRYLMNLFAVLLWPLGWAVAALVTQGILDYMTDPALKFFDPTASAYTLQQLLGVAVIGFWIVFSTVAAPVIIQQVFTQGSLAGGQLLAGAFSSALQTVATTAGAAAVASSVGSPLVTAAASTLAAGLSTLSSAAGHGSAGAIIIAGSGLPPRGARGRPGDDITGDQSVRELIAKTKNRHS